MEPLRISFIGTLPGKPPARAMLLTTDADYCTACGAMRTDLARSYDTLWARQEHHFTWLRAFVEHTGLGLLREVHFDRTTARELLFQRWGLSVPDWLTDELIHEEKLLEQDLPVGTFANAGAALLAQLIGVVGEIFPRDQAGALAEKASAPEMQAKLAASKAILAAWENTVSIWMDPKAPPWVIAFCDRLRAAPKKLWCDLTIWRLLRGYPGAEHEFALDPGAVSFVRTVPIEALRGMSLNPEGRILSLHQILPVFERACSEAVSRPKFEKLLAAVSGELKEEFFGLESMLAKSSFKIERSDASAIARRFSANIDIGPTAIARLNLFVRPPSPAKIDSSVADASVWARWFHTEYLPYRWWQTERGESDPEVESTVAAFSGWYCENFIGVHSNPAVSAIQTITQWRPAILKDSVSLILLVDNLPWFFWETFERAMAEAGLHKHESHDCFVPLPSHTAVCKPALISGRWDARGSDYLKMLEQRSHDEWDDREVRYLFGVDQLTALSVMQTPTVILLNYLASDDALHSDSAAAGTNHTEQLSLLYSSLGNAVGEFARRATHRPQAFGLYVITDHGASCILEAEKRSIDAKLAQKLFANEKDRSATLSAAEAAQVAENLWGLGHRFSNPAQSDGRVHFIPRGHNTVASPSRRPSYCHGGATPEEVIVPCAVFRLFRAGWAMPNVRFLPLKQKDGRNLFYIKRVTTVEIEIQNPNAEECRIETVTITPPVAEVRDFMKVTVGPKATGRTSVSLYFASEATAVQSLSFEFGFRIAQETLERRVALPVSIGSAAAIGTNLTELI